MSRYDGIGVIGGGLGGLAAACTLAARGCAVVLFERNEWLGGKAAVLDQGGLGTSEGRRGAYAGRPHFVPSRTAHGPKLGRGSGQRWKHCHCGQGCPRHTGSFRSATFQVAVPGHLGPAPTEFFAAGRREPAEAEDDSGRV